VARQRRARWAPARAPVRYAASMSAPPTPPSAVEATPPAEVVLDEAEAAFERGDWRAARALARRALVGPDPTRAQAASRMLARFAPDPWLVAVYAAALLAFVAVARRHLWP
jgi:hypothetical protein